MNPYIKLYYITHVNNVYNCNLIKLLMKTAIVILHWLCLKMVKILFKNLKLKIVMNMIICNFGIKMNVNVVIYLIVLNKEIVGNVNIVKFIKDYHSNNILRIIIKNVKKYIKNIKNKKSFIIIWKVNLKNNNDFTIFKFKY